MSIHILYILSMYLFVSLDTVSRELLYLLFVYCIGHRCLPIHIFRYTWIQEEKQNFDRILRQFVSSEGESHCVNTRQSAANCSRRFHLDLTFEWFRLFFLLIISGKIAIIFFFLTWKKNAFVRKKRLSNKCSKKSFNLAVTHWTIYHSRFS